MSIRGRIAFATAARDRGVIDPRTEPAPRMAPLLPMFDQPVAEARAWKDGRLELRFADGSGFEALPDDEGETWRIRWRDPQTVDHFWEFSSKGRTLLVQ